MIWGAAAWRGIRALLVVEIDADDALELACDVLAQTEALRVCLAHLGVREQQELLDAVDEAARAVDGNLECVVAVDVSVQGRARELCAQR